LLSAPQASKAAFIDGAAIARSKKPRDVWKTLSFLAMTPLDLSPTLRRLDRVPSWGRPEGSAVRTTIRFQAAGPWECLPSKTIRVFANWLPRHVVRKATQRSLWPAANQRWHDTEARMCRPPHQSAALQVPGGLSPQQQAVRQV